MNYENAHRAFRHFLDDPFEATLYGYQPCMLDVVSWWAYQVDMKMYKELFTVFCDLADCTIVEFPWEVFKLTLLVMFCLLLPLGGFLIMGVISYTTVYRKGVLQPRIIKQRERFNRNFGE